MTKERSELPACWVKTTLGEVFKWGSGGTPRRSNERYFGGNIPWAIIGDLTDGPVWETRDTITEEGLRNSAARWVEPGSVLLAMYGSIGKLGIAKVPLTTNQAIAFTKTDPILPEYLFWYLAAYRDELFALGKGGTQKNISQEVVKAFPFILAPVAQQRQLVDEIEKQFTRLDAAISCLRRAQASLKRCRKAVLKAACEGRLVPTEAELARAEGRGYQMKDILLSAESIHSKDAPYQSITNAPRLPLGWTWTTVERLNPIDRPCAYGVLQPGADREDGTLFIRVGDISEGKISRSNIKKIDPKIAASYPRTRLEGGEVLLTLVGAIGRTAVVPNDLAGANTARAVGVIPLTPCVDSRWVEIWLRSPRMRAEMTSKAHEVARKTLNLEDVRRAPIAVPPKGEQERIVAEVERRLSLVEQLEHEVEVSLSRAERLRQSILKQSFEGKLVPIDPNDIPASVLLEKIRKNREAEERNGDHRTRTRDATPRRGTDIKPGVSTPGTGTETNPKPRRDAGSVQESAHAPSGLPDLSDGPSLGLKPQALRPGPVGAEEDRGLVTVPAPTDGEEETGFLDLPWDAQIDLVWESLLGRGALEKDEAIRITAQLLRDKGLAQFQRLRQGGFLYQAIATALDRGVREGSLDRPRRGHVRALLTDPKDYSPDEWRLCLLSSLDHEAVHEDDALRAAAEWARETMGLEFARLREDGVILRGLRSALEEAVRRGEVTRVRGTIQKME